MALVLVVDTNVFLLARQHAGCGQVLNRVCFSAEHMLALDDDSDAIRKEYKDYADSHPESRLREVVSRIIELDRASERNDGSEQNLQFLLPLSNQLESEHMQFLRERGCHRPIEPEMFGIARGQPHTCLVLAPAALASIEPVRRGYRSEGTLEELRREFADDIRIVSAEDVGWLDEPGDPPPRTYSQLQAFLEQHRQDETCAEREYVELKCPTVPSNGIISTLARDVMKAVCALTNTTSGWIFIGVEDDGTIHGVPRRYNHEAVESWDMLWRMMSAQEFSFFEPRKPFVRQWFISVPGDTELDLQVIALRVTRQRGRLSQYRNEAYKRMGTSTHRIDAVNR